MLCGWEGNRRPGGSNGSLPPGGCLMPCGLTGCTSGSAPGPTLGNEYGKPLPFCLELLKAEPNPQKEKRFTAVPHDQLFFQPTVSRKLNGIQNTDPNHGKSCTGLGLSCILIH